MKDQAVTKSGSNGKKSVRRHLLEWFGFSLVLVMILYLFAPESWWQFGVSPAGERKMTADFSLKGIETGEWDFAAQRGKVVLVNYWATWCPPCRIETPGLVSIANEYTPRGVVMVGVSLDEDLSDIPPFVASYEIPYQIVLPGDDPNIDPDGIALPTTFLYDKNGRLAKKYTGIVLASTLRSDIETLLSE